MRSPSLALSTFALAPLLTLACGESFDSSPSGPPPTPIADVPELYVKALCAAVDGCASDLFTLFLGGETCEGRYDAAFIDELASLEQAFTEGKVNYDGTKLTACTDKVAALGCGVTTTRDIPECVAALEGTVAAGGACHANFVCKSGHYCDQAVACPGVCVERGASGAACTKDEHCTSGLSCGVAGRCEAPAQRGDSCGGLAGPSCAFGLVCVGASGNLAGQCRGATDILGVAPGSACDILSWTLCRAGSVCAVQSLDIVNGITVAQCEPKAPSLGACKASVPSQCPEDEYCRLANALSLAGTCVKRPKPGEDCGLAPFENVPSVCATYSACNQAGKCAAVSRVGGSCENESFCYSENCQSGVCATDNCF